MSKRPQVTLLALALVATTALAAAQTGPNVRPKEGYVPDARTAVTIAVAVLEPIYGAASVAADSPYTATLTNGIWTVRGSLRAGFVGGTAVAEIAKEDGRIVRVFHEQ
jgi:NTF2 fold immunity protein